MSQKTKYYLIGILLLLGFIIGYHFVAASQAEQQIDEAIQQQSEKHDSLSVQYSSIDIAPFGGSVEIRDLTIIFGDHIERAQHFQLDISYLDFLNIYLGGLEYGLSHLYKAKISILNPSYINQKGLEEIKLDELVINYRGNALDGLISAVNGTAFAHSHSIEAESSGLIVNLPQTTLTKISAQKFQYSGSVSKSEKNFWRNGSHQIGLDSLIWTPSESFQNNYNFFIKGFGYPADAIPFQSAKLTTTPTQQPDQLRIESAIKSDLALVSGSGLIRLKNEFGTSELHGMNISITDFSDSFRQVLQNIERLLSITLPRTENGITLQLEGTLSNPRIATN